MKYFIGIIIVILVIFTAGIYFDIFGVKSSLFPDQNNISPISKKTTQQNKLQEPVKEFTSELENQDIINILLLGIDRRSKSEGITRTDIMILATINPTKNTITLTSVPRDLYYQGQRLNALFIYEGFEGLQTAFETITGQKPSKYAMIDFEDFVWLVDALGGVPVEVQTSFTDQYYPNDITNEYQTISFTQGPELLSGERALIFARSRKGDFDNGDWGRMKRQHLILQGMADTLNQNNNFICTNKNNSDTPNKQFDEIYTSCAPFITTQTIKDILQTVTNAKVLTNLEIGDLVYLWDFYKDRKNYTVTSVLMDYNYLYTPPAQDYGGAWVLAPINNSYETFHIDLQNVINNTIPQQEINPTQELPLEEIPTELIN